MIKLFIVFVILVSLWIIITETIKMFKRKNEVLRFQEELSDRLADLTAAELGSDIASIDIKISEVKEETKKKLDTI